MLGALEDLRKEIKDGIAESNIERRKRIRRERLDYFAGKALEGLLSRESNSTTLYPEDPYWSVIPAKLAYNLMNHLDEIEKQLGSEE